MATIYLTIDQVLELAVARGVGEKEVTPVGRPPHHCRPVSHRSVERPSMKFALVLAVLASACSEYTTTRPDAVPVFQASAPTVLSLSATAGTGPAGGTALITARVQNGHGANLAGVRVTFTTDVGTLSTRAAETDADGTASLTLTAATTATVIAATGTLTARAMIHSNPNVPTVPPTPEGPPPPAVGPARPRPVDGHLIGDAWTNRHPDHLRPRVTRHQSRGLDVWRWRQRDDDGADHESRLHGRGHLHRERDHHRHNRAHGVQ